MLVQCTLIKLKWILERVSDFVTRSIFPNLAAPQIQAQLPVLNPSAGTLEMVNSDY